MRSTTGRAQSAVLDALDEALGSGADAGSVAIELFGLVAAIDSEAALNRLLTEPSVPAEAKRTVLHALLDGKVADATLKVADTSVGQRWSRMRDLPNSLEYAGISAYAAKADKDKQLDGLEDDLFRFERILDAEPGLRDALSDVAAPLQGKRELLHSLLGKSVGEATRGLLDQVVTGRRRSLSRGLSHYQKVVAERRDRLVAVVWVASPLSEKQRKRLARALTSEYSHEVHLNVIVDERVLGGVRVAIGDDVIDSTIDTRLTEVQRRLFRSP